MLLTRIALRCSIASVALVAGALAVPGHAQAMAPDSRVTLQIPAQDLPGALRALARASGQQISFDSSKIGGKKAPALNGSYTVREAVDKLLAGTGLEASWGQSGVLVVRAAAQKTSEQDTASGNARTAAADTYTANEIVVTAQKRVESVQDVPIAITALSQKNLEEQKIESGADIMRAVPNLTFSKSNFTSYNISIRGIGTKAISATSDPGVAVSFNNIGIIHNRFFEQEFFDMERMEVLRGPQGTLYGRNATGGVINLITAKPKLNKFEGNIKGEVGNYNSRRLTAMLNVPIVPDELGIRIAGAMTDRDGYDYNSVTQNRINARDLYSLRATLGFDKSWIRGNFIWERFREDDNRSRTGKQLCHRDDSPDMIGSTPTRGTLNVSPQNAPLQEIRAATFSTGCKAGSLYDDAAFGTPNGLALNQVFALAFLNTTFPTTFNPGTPRTYGYLVDPLKDPYGGMMQSRNLREIASVRDPIYRAKSDILALNLDADLSDSLTLSSQTAWNWDNVYSFQDYNRFNTLPIFNDSSSWIDSQGNPSVYQGMTPGGIFCDPQIGCTNTLATFDVSSATSKQFSQELRLQSDFDGSFNFSIGGNYTKFKTQNDYYVMSNMFTMIAMSYPFNFTGTSDHCHRNIWALNNSMNTYLPIEEGFCPYIDPNPVESINGEGHNYFRSSNPYKLESWALFGESYYNINSDLKLTAGLRYTHDKKNFTVVPSQLLLATTIDGGGFINKGHPATGVLRKSWGEYTGRIGLDWKPDLGFTDDTLLYAFYSRGYKAGGFNPPTPGYATTEQWIEAGYITQQIADLLPNLYPTLFLPAVDYGPTFEPEFVNAFEIGTKNVLMGGRLTLNAGAFFYDYTNYQVSQIRDRTAVNENFDAKVWGAEMSALFEPVDRLRFNANIGYLKTRIGKGSRSIDPMNRNLGDPNYTVVKSWVQLPSNCVVPVHVVEAYLKSQPTGTIGAPKDLCKGAQGALFHNAPIDPLTGAKYDPASYPELNGGLGLYTELEGNELPNSPRWTVNLGAEYTIPFDGDWSATIRGDGYWQGKSWARVYNLAPYDRLRSWTNFNIALRVDGPDDLSIEAYVKNVFNKTPITDAFLNSDDSGLTTNIFTLDPRIIGFSIAKKF